MKIGNKSIGKNSPVFIIAEAGVNHNGKLDLAKKLVDAAVDAGADAVKFQTFKTEGVVTSKIKIADYAKKNIGMDEKQINMIKNLELQYGDFKILKEYCDKKGIIFLSTPHSFDAIDFLEDLLPAYKFGSGDITNIPALKYAAKKNKPIILGTGMSTLKEVKFAVDSIKSENNKQIITLHCTTNYPCPLEEVNLNSMLTMQKELDCLVGYSDHTAGTMVPIIATALGAVVIEKHITTDKNLPGPDHKASLEPDELKTMITEIRNVEKALGSFDKKPTESEKKIMKIVRKSIVAKQDIKKGSIIKKNMLIIKRPGTGLKPMDLDKIIGKKIKKHIAKDEILQLGMVE
jgi:N-acetylneuraminate synthase/N,N'-diacetyllegionaminate synthase